jgi:hypothetical protein
MILQQYSYTVEVARRLCQTPRAGAQFGWQDLSAEQLLHCSVAGACSRLPPSRRVTTGTAAGGADGASANRHAAAGHTRQDVAVAVWLMTSCSQCQQLAQ